jgi:hypothetical protein
MNLILSSERVFYDLIEVLDCHTIKENLVPNTNHLKVHDWNNHIVIREWNSIASNYNISIRWSSTESSHCLDSENQRNDQHILSRTNSTAFRSMPKEIFHSCHWYRSNCKTIDARIRSYRHSNESIWHKYRNKFIRLDNRH